MKGKFVLLFLGLVLIASCSPAETISGTYHGQYTNNALIVSNTTLTVTGESANSVSVTFSGPGVPALTLNGISITTNNNSFSLTKINLFDVIAGTVDKNNISFTYTQLVNVITFDGTK